MFEVSVIILSFVMFENKFWWKQSINYSSGNMCVKIEPTLLSQFQKKLMKTLFRAQIYILKALNQGK